MSASPSHANAQPAPVGTIHRPVVTVSVLPTLNMQQPDIILPADWAAQQNKKVAQAQIQAQEEATAGPQPVEAHEAAVEPIEQDQQYIQVQQMAAASILRTSSTILVASPPAIAIDIDLTEADVIEAYHLHSYPPDWRTVVIFLLFSFLVMGESWGLSFWLALPLTLFLGMGAVWANYRYLRPHLAHKAFQRGLYPTQQTIRWDQNHLYRIFGSYHGRNRWIEIIRTRESDKLLMLYHRRGEWFIFPKRCFKHPEHLLALTQLANRRKLLEVVDLNDRPPPGLENRIGRWIGTLSDRISQNAAIQHDRARTAQGQRAGNPAVKSNPPDKRGKTSRTPGP